MAGITISTVFSEDGLIQKVQQAKDAQLIAMYQDRIEIVCLDWSLDKSLNDEIGIDDLWVKMKDAEIILDIERDVEKLDDKGNYVITVPEGYKFQIHIGENGDAEVEYIGKEDSLLPYIQSVEVIGKTTNSVTVEVTVTREGENLTLSYYYKKLNDSEESYVAIKENVEEKTVEVTGLESETIYQLKVIAKNENGENEKTVELTVEGIIGAGEGLKEGAIIASEPTWDSSSHTASITLSKGADVASNLSIQWQIGGIAEGSWTTGTSVTGIQHGQTVYARLTDGINHGDEGSVSIKDTIAPAGTTISPSATSTETGKAITAAVVLKDNESGVNVGSSKWVYNTTAGNIGTNGGSYTGGTFSQESQTITLNASTEGTYYLHVLTVDKAGNAKETISGAITVKKPAVADGSFNSSKGVNSPDLADGKLTPIKWNGSSWVETTADDNSWYNYSTSSKQWANAKTSDGSMWVWIPRYAYQISSGYHSNSAGTINIKFMQGTSNTAADGYTSWDNSSGQGNWNIHPAFNYNGTKAGIWVAKFEASRNNATSSSAGSGSTLKIQPGVQSWRNTNINDIFNTCKNYNSSLNSHMMKNSEWGAVAYLAQSSYGMNGEVWINPNSNHLTGQAGTSTNASGTTTTYAYSDTTYGVKASTTGTIYGIYDMNGGSDEYVAAYINNMASQQNGSSLASAPIYMKDTYSVGIDTDCQTNYEVQSNIYGDAVYETSNAGYSQKNAWHGDSTGFPWGSYPFITRGGQYNYAESSGLFRFENVTGLNKECSMHVVLISP